MVNRLEVIKKFESICYINSQNDIMKICNIWVFIMIM